MAIRFERDALMEKLMLVKERPMRQFETVDKTGRMRVVFTLPQFIQALRRAEADDHRWPWLRSAEWLLERARADDHEVLVDMTKENSSDTGRRTQ